MTADPGEELFDVCDEADQVIGQAPRREVHARGWLHRAVHLWVFNSAGALVLQRRAATKDEYPLTYTSSASGHLAAGEDYATAAERELLEEMGLQGPLCYVTKLPASVETAREHTVLYRMQTDEPPTPDPDEVASLVWWSPGEITARIAATPAEFSPPFVALWRWWEANGSTTDQQPRIR